MIDLLVIAVIGLSACSCVLGFIAWTGLDEVRPMPEVETEKEKARRLIRTATLKREV